MKDGSACERSREGGTGGAPHDARGHLHASSTAAVAQHDDSPDESVHLIVTCVCRHPPGPASDFSQRNESPYGSNEPASTLANALQVGPLDRG